MTAHPHIPLHLPVVAVGPAPGTDDRPWFHLSRRRRWLELAIVISLLIHTGAVLMVFHDPVHELPESRAAAPAEWMVEVEPNKPSGSAEARGTPDGSKPQPPPVVAIPLTPPPAPRENRPEPKPAPEQAAPVRPLPPSPPAADIPPRPQTPPVEPGRTATIAPPPPPPPPAAKAPAPPPRPVIPLSPMIGTSPFQQKPPAPAAAQQPAAPQGQERGLNIVMGKAERITGDPPRRNLSDESFDMQVEGAQVGTDWMQQVRRFWVRHRFYPDDAVANLEQGTVTIRFKVDRRGHVFDYHQLESSGSRQLDLAARSVFANADLPAFPFNTPENEATLTLHITYSIIFFGPGR